MLTVQHLLLVACKAMATQWGQGGRPVRRHAISCMLAAVRALADLGQQS